ncbi:hypothetical protein FQN57_005037 [Myotisia sp. PD_48]|nr:hypothetical protein FQN57_005037 [Myotisia sp. PD_48]
MRQEQFRVDQCNIMDSMVEQPDQMVELVTISSAPLDECCGVESNPEIIKLEEGVVQVQPPDLDPDPNIVDWDGPDDPMNPINWTPRQKYTALTTVTLIVFLTTATATMFAPSLPNVMKGYSSSSKELSYFVLSVYSLGRALGPLSIAPLSELYGRQPMYHMCNVLFLISVLACAAAPSLPALVAFRFISGVAGGGPVSLGTGTLADMVPQEKRGKAMGWWAIAPMFQYSSPFPHINVVIGSSGLPFLGMSIGTIIGLAISGLTSDRLLADLSKRNSHRLDDLSAGGGEKKPEYRLPIMIPGSLLIPASLFWYGWSLELRSHYLSPIFALGVFGVGTSLVFRNCSKPCAPFAAGIGDTAFRAQDV